MSSPPKTAHSLLQEKAANFRAFIETFTPDETAQKLIASFNPTLLIPTIHMALLPLKQNNKLDETATTILSHLTVPEAEKQAVKDKIKRYLECFCDLATQ